MDDPFSSGGNSQEQPNPIISSLLQEINTKNNAIVLLKQELRALRQKSSTWNQSQQQTVEKGIQTDIHVTCDIGIQSGSPKLEESNSNLENEMKCHQQAQTDPLPASSFQSLFSSHADGLLQNLESGKKWIQEYSNLLAMLGIHGNLFNDESPDAIMAEQTMSFGTALPQLGTSTNIQETPSQDLPQPSLHVQKSTPVSQLPFFDTPFPSSSKPLTADKKLITYPLAAKYTHKRRTSTQDSELSSSQIDEAVKRRRKVSGESLASPKRSSPSIPQMTSPHTSSESSLSSISSKMITLSRTELHPYSSTNVVWNYFHVLFKSLIKDSSGAWTLDCTHLISSPWMRITMREHEQMRFERFQSILWRFWSKECSQYSQLQMMPGSESNIINLSSESILVTLPSGKLLLPTSSVHINIPQAELGPILVCFVLYQHSINGTYPCRPFITTLIKFLMVQVVRSTAYQNDQLNVTYAAIRWIVSVCRLVHLSEPLRVLVLDILEKSQDKKRAKEIASSIVDWSPSILEQAPQNSSITDGITLSDLVKVILDQNSDDKADESNQDQDKQNPVPSAEEVLKPLFVSFHKHITSLLTISSETRSAVHKLSKLSKDRRFELIKYVGILSSFMDASFAYYFVRRIWKHLIQTLEEDSPDVHVVTPFLLDLIHSVSTKLSECDEETRSWLKTSLSDLVPTFTQQEQIVWQIRIVQILLQLRLTLTEEEHIWISVKDFVDELWNKQQLPIDIQQWVQKQRGKIKL